MTRKRMIKLLMGFYCNRNNAVRLANKCDGDLSHEADMTGAVAGMVGSVYE